MAVRKPDIDAPGAKAEEMPKNTTTKPAEVPAGPGDAGRSDRPEKLPRPKGERGRLQQIGLLLVALAGFTLIIWLVSLFGGTP